VRRNVMNMRGSVSRLLRITAERTSEGMREEHEQAGSIDP